MIGSDKNQSDDHDPEKSAEEVGNDVIWIEKTSLLLVIEFFTDANDDRGDESHRSGGRAHPDRRNCVNDQRQHQADAEVNVLVLPDGSDDVGKISHDTLILIKRYILFCPNICPAHHIIKH